MTKLIDQAVHILKQGGLIGLPTETVYGLAADAKNKSAVAKVFIAKGRPSDHPLIVHIGTLAELIDWAIEIPTEAYRLAEHYWPGPLTLVLKKHPAVLSEITGGQDSIAIRMPKHPLALQLLRAFGSAVVAPSANQFGHISPTDEAAVLAELGTQVDLVLPGGRTAVGIESTIVDLCQKPFKILRQGMLSQQALEHFLAEKLVLSDQPTTTTTRAPGLLATHYAPHTPLQLFDIKDLPKFMGQAVAVLAQSPQPDFAKNIPWRTMPTRPEAYAFELYAALRTADGSGAQLILVETPLQAPEWAAIHDRLHRAAFKSTVD